MRHINPDFKRLCLFAGSDPTRIALTSIHMNKELEKTVSCDGVRLFACQSFYNEKRAGKTYEIDAFAAGEYYVEKQVDYPDISTLIPKKLEHSVTTEIPAWLTNFKNKKNTIPASPGKPGEWITLSNQSNEQYYLEKSIIIDLAFLAPLAGQSVKFAYHNSKSPCLIEPVDSADAWFAVIMPRRCI